MKKYMVSILYILSCLLILTTRSQAVPEVQVAEPFPEPEIKMAFAKEKLLADYNQCWKIPLRRCMELIKA